MKITSNMKTNQDELTNQNVLKNRPPTQQQFCPPSLSYYDITWFFFKTSHLDSHTTNDVKPGMLSGVQTGNRIPHDEYNLHGIAHACAYRKDDIFMQRRLVQSFTYYIYMGVGARHQKPKVSCKRCAMTRPKMKHKRRRTFSALQYSLNPFLPPSY